MSSDSENGERSDLVSKRKVSWRLISSSPTNLILLSLFVAAVGFALVVSWLFRRVAAQPSHPLNRLSRAYLIGGPNRAREVAFFQLVTEGWVKPLDDGNFVSRIYTVNDDVTGLLPLEREMLEWASKQVNFTSHEVMKRRYRELKVVEQELIRSQLVLSEGEFAVSKAVSLIPIGILAIDGILHLANNLSRHVNEPRWVILVVATMLALFQLANASKRSTELGSVQRDLILKESRIRIRQSKQATHDGNPSTYDLLWKMGDQVLVGGLQALGGTLFMKPSRQPNVDVITKTGKSRRFELSKSGRTQADGNTNTAVDTASGLDINPDKSSSV